MNTKTKAMKMMDRRKIITMKSHDNKVSYENEKDDESDENDFKKRKTYENYSNEEK